MEHARSFWSHAIGRLVAWSPRLATCGSPFGDRLNTNAIPLAVSKKREIFSMSSSRGVARTNRIEPNKSSARSNRSAMSKRCVELAVSPTWGPAFKAKRWTPAWSRHPRAHRTRRTPMVDRIAVGHGAKWRVSREGRHDPMRFCRQIFLSAATIIFATFWLSSTYRASAQMSDADYDRLPQEVRTDIEETRNACRELDPEMRLYAIDQGITIIDLDGHGPGDIMVDYEDVCTDRRTPVGHCSNRGCDLTIWKRAGNASWKKVFDEHLHRKFISLSERNRFQLMAVSIYAGDPRCKPDPKRSYTSGRSCDALVYYRNGSWIWHKIQ
jgi:hypothetical protein